MRCDEKQPNPWPYRPDHITNDGADYGLWGTGILSSRHVQGIQSEMCHEIGQPTTIIEFAPSGEAAWRTDSPLLTHQISEACRAFRDMNRGIAEDGDVRSDGRATFGGIRGALCLRCDQLHAGLLRGVEESQLTPAVVHTRWERSDELQRWHNHVPDCVFRPFTRDGRLVVEYDCPLLGYRELLFPIIFEGRVIAGFFTGQMTLTDHGSHQSRIERQMESLPDRFDSCFEVWLREHVSDRTPQDAAQEILSAHRRQLSSEAKRGRPSGTLRESDYLRILDTALKEIDGLEVLLNEEMEHQRITYIRRTVSSELAEFSKPGRVGCACQGSDHHSLLAVWARVEHSMNRLVRFFSLRYALAFGATRTISMPKDMLHVVAKTDRWEEILSKEELEKIRLDAAGFPGNYTVSSRDQNPGYLSLIRGCDISKLGDFQLVLVPVAAHPHSSVAFVLGYGGGHPSTALENRLGSDLHTALQSFDTLVVSSVAAALARGAEDNARRQLMYLGHEAGQLTSGLDWLRLTYLEKPSDVRQLPKRKIEDLCRDLEGFVGQLSFVFDMASQMGTDRPPEADMEDFRPFGDVLFKWKDTYRREIEKKCLQIRVADVRTTDPWRPVIHGDKFLFEQLVYNLVNNAEKYSHRGTKIDLDCRLGSLQDERSPHILTVTDYGRHMASGRDAYLPFTRGDTDVKGLGLGLYISWLIVERVFHGTIQHHCAPEPVSRFNIPLIRPYIERRFPGRDAALAEELATELARLRGLEEYGQAVAFRDEKQNQRYEPSDEALKNEIHTPTYKVTMRATIPHQRRKSS